MSLLHSLQCCSIRQLIVISVKACDSNGVVKAAILQIVSNMFPRTKDRLI